MSQLIKTDYEKGRTQIREGSNKEQGNDKIQTLNIFFLSLYRYRATYLNKIQKRPHVHRLTYTTK
jgi:hypothetical protein